MLFSSNRFQLSRCSLVEAILGIGLAFMAHAAVAQQSQPLGAEQRAIIDAIEPAARVDDDGLVRTENAVTTCILLLQRTGFFIEKDGDPRVLGFDPELSQPAYEIAMPAGIDPCFWTTLIDLASLADVEVLVQFFDAAVGEIIFPPPPKLFADAELKAQFGFEADATPPQIMPEYTRLRGIVAEVNASVQVNYYTRIARIDADAARQDAEAARRQLEIAREILDLLTELGDD